MVTEPHAPAGPAPRVTYLPSNTASAPHTIKSSPDVDSNSRSKEKLVRVVAVPTFAKLVSNAADGSPFHAFVAPSQKFAERSKFLSPYTSAISSVPPRRSIAIPSTMPVVLVEPKLAATVQVEPFQILYTSSCPSVAVLPVYTTIISPEVPSKLMSKRGRFPSPTVTFHSLDQLVPLKRCM